MTTRTRSFGLAAALAVIALFATTAASAQMPWGCSNAKICNQTNCTVRLSIGTIPFSIITVNLTPGQCVNVATAITSMDRVIGAAGIGYPILAPPPGAACNCGAGSWSVCCVTLPPQNCCCDVCFDPANCRIFVRPALCPAGTCRP